MRLENVDARAAVRAFLDAASTGDVTAVDAYIRSGGDVNAVLGEGWTALHSAASHGQVRVLERLINDASCDLNTVSAIGTTALAMALRMRDNIATRVLLDGGASRATIAKEELCRVWDADWLWLDVQRRLHPGWSIVWTPDTHHRFSRQERDKCRLILCINHVTARLDDASNCSVGHGDSDSGVVATVASAMVRVVTAFYRGDAGKPLLPSRHQCSWVYLPPSVVRLILQYALFLW